MSSLFGKFSQSRAKLGRLGTNIKSKKDFAHLRAWFTLRLLITIILYSIEEVYTVYSRTTFGRGRGSNRPGSSSRRGLAHSLRTVVDSWFHNQVSVYPSGPRKVQSLSTSLWSICPMTRHCWGRHYILKSAKTGVGL